ncbi:M23 family metallopeptidase [Actinoplanes oblitus]|uniref:M23 family metallopeptidase n=1 Tax=Actinoplanes oblitus TaxID=3040509 RepID=A0ABY8WH62_9ACTN|nr:M23 family metallopeptidase [Actinoplanes oblitus]WIM97224.1 M23 family metallopeptidase [Actinoplanes oblitus]
MRQTSASGSTGRHRQERLHRHRAPAFPALFASRGRSAVSLTALTATLATGIGAASASASAADHTSDEKHTAAHAPAALPIVPPADDEAPAKTHLRQPAAHRAAVVPATVQRKAKPLPREERTTAVAGGAAWVNPNPTARVTSCFGQRWGRLHAGVDLAAADGTPIVAAGAGVVVAAGMAQGYGNAVLIDHGDGWLTHYGHLSRIAVTVGESVRAGQRIGDEGSTGHSTGPHLHFEVHQGHYKNPVEPTAWMREHGVDIPGC